MALSQLRLLELARKERDLDAMIVDALDDIIVDARLSADDRHEAVRRKTALVRAMSAKYAYPDAGLSNR